MWLKTSSARLSQFLSSGDKRTETPQKKKWSRDNKGSADSQSLGESGALRHVRRPPILPFLLNHPPPALLCSIRALWLGPHPVAYKSHWLMASQLPRTRQRTGASERGLLQIKAAGAAAGLGPPSSGSPKHQRTGEPPRFYRTDSAPALRASDPALFGSIPGCVCSCGSERRSRRSSRRRSKVRTWASVLTGARSSAGRSEWDGGLDRESNPGFYPGCGHQSSAFIASHKEKELLRWLMSFVS